MKAQEAPPAPRDTPRRTLLLKLLFAVGTFAFLVWSGHLDAAALSRFGAIDPLFYALACLGMLLSQSLTFVRHTVLLRTACPSFPFPRGIRIGFIGLLFSNVMPGSVGGDAIRLVYLLREPGLSRPHALSSLVFDRLAGLSGLLILATLALTTLPAPSAAEGLAPFARGAVLLLSGLAYASVLLFASAGMGRRPALLLWLALSAALAVLQHSSRDLGSRAPHLVGVALLGLAVVLVGTYLARLAHQPGESRLHRIPGGALLLRLLHAAFDYARFPRAAAAALGLALLSQLVIIAVLWLAAQALGLSNPPSFHAVLVAGPYAFLANALPLSFGGAGVGEFSFQQALPLLTASSTQGACVHGALIFLCYRSIKLLVSLLGFPVYLATPRVRTPA